MNDINEEFVAKGYNKIKKSLEKAVTKGRMTEEAKEGALANLTTTVSLEDAKDADFVIEACIGNKEIKLGIFKQLDKICKPEAILRFQYIFPADHRNRGSNRKIQIR